MILCNCLVVNTQGSISSFEVFNKISIDDYIKKVKYSVYYNDEECDVKCTCALFEMRGIICMHIFKVCQTKDINVLPDNYVLYRWRKDLKRRYTLIKSSYNDLRNNVDAQRYELVVKRCLKFVTRVSPSDEHVDAFLQLLDEFELQCTGLITDDGLNKLRKNMVLEKGKKVLSSHVSGERETPSEEKGRGYEERCHEEKEETSNKFFALIVFYINIILIGLI